MQRLKQFALTNFDYADISQAFKATSALTQVKKSSLSVSVFFSKACIGELIQQERFHKAIRLQLVKGIAIMKRIELRTLI